MDPRSLNLEHGRRGVAVPTGGHLKSRDRRLVRPPTRSRKRRDCRPYRRLIRHMVASPINL